MNPRPVPGRSPGVRCLEVCLAALVSASAALAFGGCGRTDFDGERALAFLERQCEFGPRPPGSRAHRETLEWLIGTLEPLADVVSVQRFTVGADTGETTLTNVIASFHPGEQDRILLGAHWDTRAIADRDPDVGSRNQPILGANDGASGVAVLLEIATIVAGHPPPVGVDLVFFDGEDGGDGGGLPDWCMGSTYYAAHLGGYSPAYAIVVDMIGDKDLTIRREETSLSMNPDLVDIVWEAAQRVGSRRFVRQTWEPIYDDHVPLLRSGIPSVLLIDFDYHYWHTLEDTPDKCSSESLAEVGRVLVELAYRGTRRL